MTLTATIILALLAATGPALVLGAPIPSIPSTLSGSILSTLPKRGIEGSAYVQLSGNGVTWPATTAWVSSFDEMFSANKPIIQGSCTQWGVPNNSEQETASIHDSINTVAAETGIDARFILAVMLQESNGCVRAPTTNYGVRNPGLMQDHDGAASCNDAGKIQNPCPSSTITQMIRDGVAGTAAGDGLKQTYAQAPGAGAQKYYGAARIYNSGSISADGNLGSGIATHCYASDVANRLTGWTFQQKTCSLDGAPAPAQALPPTISSAPAQPFRDPVPSSPAPAPIATIPEAPTVSQSAGKASPNNLAPGISSSCMQYYTIQAGDYCDAVAAKFGTTFAKLRQLNTGLDAGCSNLWKGYDYCVKGS